MDDDKSLEQQASEDLAELEAEEKPSWEVTLSDRVDKLEETLRATFELLQKNDLEQAELLARVVKQLEEVVTLTQHSLINEMMVFRQRLDRLDPSFNQLNCSKCGAKLRHVGGKCHVCGLQN